MSLFRTHYPRNEPSLKTQRPSPIGVRALFSPMLLLYYIFNHLIYNTFIFALDSTLSLVQFTPGTLSKGFFLQNMTDQDIYEVPTTDHRLANVGSVTRHGKLKDIFLV